jgi:hypothetical protein
MPTVEDMATNQRSGNDSPRLNSRRRSLFVRLTSICAVRSLASNVRSDQAEERR